MSADRAPIVVLPEAAEEIGEATLWYEHQAPGLGADFLRAVEAGVEAIQRHPEAYRIVRGTIRRLILRRFPYILLYSWDNDTVALLGCLHAARDPDERDRRTD